MLPYPLNNFEIQKYYQNVPRLNGVYSRNNLPKVKEGSYVITLDEYKSIGTHWMALYVNDNNVTYFYSFGVENIPKEIKKFIDNRNITTKYKSIVKKKKQKHDKIVLLGKAKLNTVEVLISKTLINSNIIHDIFVSVNNVLKEYDDMKEEIKNSNSK